LQRLTALFRDLRSGFRPGDSDTTPRALGFERDRSGEYRDGCQEHEHPPPPSSDPPATAGG